MKILADWKDLLSFIAKPSILSQETTTLGKARILLSTYLFKIIVTILLGLFFVYMLGLKDDSSGYMADQLKGLYHPIVLFTMVAVIEEVAFRGFLTKFNPILFALSISTMAGLFFKKIVYRNMVFETHGLLEMFALILVLGGLTYLLAQKYREQLTLFWERNFRAIVIISAVLFGLIHFANSETLEPKFLVTTISQLISGFTLAFIRIRSGLFWAILIHFCWNIMLGL